ncbi:hypothetical protein ACTFIW_010442 [Dictyostelium discoideum]
MCNVCWIQRVQSTEIAIKLNTLTENTECREAITELVLNNAGKFFIGRPSDSESNTGENFPMKKNHAVPKHNSHCRNSFEAQAEKIIAAILLELRKGSNVDLKKIRICSIVYRESQSAKKQL